MKNPIRRVSILSVCSLFIFTSCDKSKTAAAVTPSTPLSVIKADPSLTIFSAIESLSGDDNYVNNGPALVIPVDSAFLKAGITAAIAGAFTPTKCDSIVKFYISESKFNFSDSANREMPFQTDLGASLFADSTATVLYFNGIAAVSQTPVVAGNTSLYKLSQYLTVPEATIAQIIAADTSLSLLGEALAKTNLSSSISNGAYTVFMPSNTAFAAAGFPSIASIDSANTVSLTTIMLYHIVQNLYFYNDLAGQTSLSTQMGGTIQVGNSNGLQLSGFSNPSSPATLLTNGTMAGNVLTYKISSVLLP